jgi:hypothetical protein
MDTDDLSQEAYKAIILEAEMFDHNLTLQFGLLSSHCKNEEEYLNQSVKLIDEIKELEDEELDDLFFGEEYDKDELIIALDKIIANIAQVKKIPKDKRVYDF